MFLPLTPRAILLRLLMLVLCCCLCIVYELYLHLFFTCLVIAGSSCNSLAMYMNEWRMPVATNDLVLINDIWSEKTHDVASCLTKVRCLCDVIEIKNQNIVSIGDIICPVGIAGLIINMMYLIYRL